MNGVDDQQLYNELVASGIASREKRDKSQWTLGACCSQVDSRWGEQRLKRYASDINIGYSTARLYRQIWNFYYPSYTDGFATRVAELRALPILAYTHFRHAMMLDHLPVALHFLDECANNGWNTDLALAVLMERTGKGPSALLVAQFAGWTEALDFIRAHEAESDYIIKVYKRGIEKVVS